MLISAEAILPVKSVADSIRFYREVLGFENDWTYEGGGFGGATSGAVHFMFRQSDEPHTGSTVYMTTREIDALYERHLSFGVVVAPIEDKSWGRREYVVRDPDGHTLVFSGKAGTTRPGSGLLPDEVSFEDRIPSAVEFNTLRRAVQWSDSAHAEEILAKTWGGVVAVVSGQVAGMLRITMDSEGWFGIWDVVVTPEWQAKRIGENLVNRAVDQIRSASSGAIVFLFTFQDPFYAKAGFSIGDAMMRRL